MQDWIEFDSKTLPLWFGLGLSLAVALALAVVMIVMALARRIFGRRTYGEEP
ncbi:MAG: hypothetical protein JWR08_2181 [Enterovirga sp.]|jgi:hypothetical protein|nr:hypothetical protein [Enterovirga sp.]